MLPSKANVKPMFKGAAFGALSFGAARAVVALLIGSRLPVPTEKVSWFAGVVDSAFAFSWAFPLKQVGLGVALVDVTTGPGFTATTVFAGALEHPSAVVAMKV